MEGIYKKKRKRKYEDMKNVQKNLKRYKTRESMKDGRYEYE